MLETVPLKVMNNDGVNEGERRENGWEVEVNDAVMLCFAPSGFRFSWEGETSRKKKGWGENRQSSRAQHVIDLSGRLDHLIEWSWRAGPVFDDFTQFFKSWHFSCIFGHVFEIIQNLQNKINLIKNVKNTIKTNINQVYKYPKNNSFLARTNTPTPRFCSSSSKTKLKILEKEKRNPQKYYVQNWEKICTHSNQLNYPCNKIVVGI